MKPSTLISHVLVVVIPLFFVSCDAGIDYLALIRADPRISEDGRSGFMKLAEKYGHPAEEHYVITEDGYILTAFRLPGNKSQPILLLHGNIANADVFVLRGYTSMGITLANKNYDVWIINYRGTVYSRSHVSLDPEKDEKRFFDYTFTEQGIYDTTATIDYVLKKTGQTKLVAMGHSLGTSSAYAMLSLRPEYNDKLKLFVALAPVVFLKNQIGVAKIAGITGGAIDTVLQLAGVSRVGGFDTLQDYLTNSYCLGGALAYNVCIKGGLFPATGFDESGLEQEFLPTALGHLPEATTRKILTHNAQLSNNRFAQYDYGADENMRVYNSAVAPQFPLCNVTAKQALIVAKNDFISTIPDVDKLSNVLKRVVYYKVLPMEDFNHIDFTLGRHVPETFYPYLLGIIEKYI